MTGRMHAFGMGGASALAIGAVFILAPASALACTAIGQPEGAVESVAITCSDFTPVVQPFTTRYEDGDGERYSGNGADSLTMTGGSIVSTGLATPEVTEGLTTYNLDPSGGVVQMLGGIDTVDISGGTIGATGAPINLDLGDGADIFAMSGGTINGTVFGGEGDDDIEVSGNAIITGVPGISAAIETGNGNNDVRILGGTIGSDPAQLAIFLDGAGANTFEMSNGTVNGSIVGQGGGNTYTITNGAINGFLSAGSGNDGVLVSGGVITGYVSGDSGDDEITIGGGTITSFVEGGLGDDIITIGGGTIGSTVEGDDGDDQILMSGGLAGADVDLGAGADLFEMSGGAVAGSVFGLGGGNTFNLSGGTINGALFAGSEGDTVTISGTTNIAGGAPDSVGLEDGDDTFTMSGGTLAGAVSGGNGADTLTISGGTVGSFVAGNAGDDLIFVTGGTIQDDVRGNEGVDRITISGGTITGDVEGETVVLSGGTIGGDITGISDTTLIIDGSGVNPLDLRDGVVFSGTNAVGSITGEDLAAGGETQNFAGFGSVSMSASTLRFGAGAQDIGLLTLGDGSTLFVNGNTSMAGNVVVTGSMISMIDGAADDVFTLGGLTLNGGTIGLDLNQQTGLADQLVAGAFAANGANTIVVNLLGAPEFAQATDIPIIVSTNGPIAGTFATGITGTPSSLFTYEVIAGPTGGLFIRATPANFGIATAPDSAVNAATVNTAIDALYGINDDAIDADLGLANGAQRIQISPTFGVFASGQFAHTEHDGFTISGNGLVGAGPSFDANDFSAAISLDFNAAKHFGFDDRYGLNLGLFGGYASTDVGLGAFQGFANIGDADNRSGMFGGYALFRQGVNYALVSASTFLGETDVSNGVLNTTGSYDTEGFAVTGSVGHIFALSDRMRFDLRGGILGVSFTGDDYTDSGGNQFGESRISFGAFKFEPGIYADFALENGMVFSPYARADLQQRFAYKNTATIDSREIEFDDADFSAAFSGGFNLRMSEKATLSSEVRGKLSSDSSTIGGKLGLKIAF